MVSNLLPGGLIRRVNGDAQLRRDFVFRKCSGELDLQLHDCLNAAHRDATNYPQWLTQVLTVLLAQLCGVDIGDDEASREQVRQLCVGDRHYLLLQWQLRRSHKLQWHSAECPACQANYDFNLNWAELPVKPAASGFPYLCWRLGDIELNLRVASGGDQEWLAHLPANESEQAIKIALLQRLVVAVEASERTELEARVAALSPTELAAIEVALETLAAEVANSVYTRCPECDASHEVGLDLAAQLVSPVASLFDEVHLLAANYHWSEADILRLSPARRAQYLHRLDRQRGIHAGH